MDYVLMIRSESEEINAEAEKVVASMTFDVTEIPEELQGHWLVYKYTVRLPDGMQR